MNTYTLYFIHNNIKTEIDESTNREQLEEIKKDLRLKDKYKDGIFLIMVTEKL